MESFCFKGNSGCKIEVLQGKASAVVRKHSSGADYNSRLAVQATKQARLLSALSSSDFIAPKVLSIGEDYFDMDFFHGKDMISHFSSCGKDSIVNFCKIILDFINVEIQNSSLELFHKCAFLDKFYKLKPALESVDAARIESYFNNLPTIMIPHGMCHGDLTLSNMLVNKLEDQICLIDFLDTFYETPLQDVVKLRQDTKYMWSMLFYNHEHDSTRYKIVMAYIDEQLEKHISDQKWYQTYYRPFQMMNFLRIVPYSSGKKRDFVIRQIGTMVNEWT